MNTQRIASSPVGLGDRVKDSITGASGIVVSVHMQLHGKTLYLVQPECVDTNLRPVEPSYFEGKRLVVLQACAVE